MFRKFLYGSVCLVPLCAAAVAASPLTGGTFSLGQIETVTVSGTQEADKIASSTITADKIYKYAAGTLDQALEYTPGVSIGTTGGTRNEKLFFIRGFDRFQNALYVDGIRIYLPVDNRLDIGFFNTQNLSQVQVEKGYVSVLSGPGAMGGAINMVTSKPTEALEYKAQGGLAIGNEGYDGFNAAASIGSRQSKYYIQGSGTITKYDHTDMSEDFDATDSENGGKRNHTASRNYGMNLKVGYTPNATDEYSLSYSGQWGRKEAPYSTREATTKQKNWTWPYWDVQNIYFLSHTQLGENAYVKTRFYYSNFRNGLYSYDDATFTTQSYGKAFRSYYSDYAYGGNIEGGYRFGDFDTLKISYFYRRDSHTEWETTYKVAMTEPKQNSVEDTHSIAIENRMALMDHLDFVLGGSYDYRHLMEAEDYDDGMVDYPLADDDAVNLQGKLIYDFGGGDSLHVSISDRTRFPTLNERFSTKFGTTLSNPNLNAERAINYEIGGAWNLSSRVHVEGAVFYSHITKAIESVPINFCDTTSEDTSDCTGTGGAAGVLTTTNQSQNVGKAKYVGFELATTVQILDTLSTGLNYSYVDRSIDEQDPDNPDIDEGFHLTDMPNSQLFFYVTWNPTPKLTVTPNLKTASNRWSTDNDGNYFKMGSYTVVGLQGNYAITDRIDFNMNINNLLDVNYEQTYGFPSQGRNFHLALRIKS